MSVMQQIRTLLIALAVLGVGLTAWRYDLPGLLGRYLPQATTQKSVQFDNGSVREPARVQTQVVPRVRKCVRGDPTQRGGQEVVYTDRDCPPGTQEQRLDADARINVVPATVAAPAGPQPAGSQPAFGQRKGVPDARELLLGNDTHKLQTAKDQQMDKAVNR